MKKEMTLSLRAAAERVAEMFSNKDRGGNHAGEDFVVGEITVLSDVTACVIFDKSSGKQAVAWFYFIASQAKPRWEFFFVTYSHLVGLNRVAAILHRAEQHNYRVTTEELR